MDTEAQIRDETVWPPPPANSLPPADRLPPTKLEVFWQIVGRTTAMGIIRGALCGAGFGVFFYIIGAIYGLFIGAIAGLLLGCITGFVLAFATCRYFYPLEDAEKYRRLVGAFGVAIAFIPGLLAVIASVRSPDATTVLMLVVFLPSLIAMIAAWTAGQRLAAWYTAEMSRGQSLKREAPTLI